MDHVVVLKVQVVEMEISVLEVVSFGTGNVSLLYMVKVLGSIICIIMKVVVILKIFGSVGYVGHIPMAKIGIVTVAQMGEKVL